MPLESYLHYYATGKLQQQPRCKLYDVFMLVSMLRHSTLRNHSPTKTYTVLALFPISHTMGCSSAAAQMSWPVRRVLPTAKCPGTGWTGGSSTWGPTITNRRMGKVSYLQHWDHPHLACSAYLPQPAPTLFASLVTFAQANRAQRAWTRKNPSAQTPPSTSGIPPCVDKWSKFELCLTIKAGLKSHKKHAGHPPHGHGRNQ